MDDFEKVRDALTYEGYADNSSALAALARLEAEHKRLEGRDTLCTMATNALDATRLLLGAQPGEATLDVVNRLLEENQRLRADSERLEQARQLLWELFDYGHAELHEVDETDTECPGDDSCRCPLVAKFNAVLKGWEPQ